MTQRLDLTPERIEFTVKRGDTFRFTITPDPISAWDGATFAGHVRADYGGSLDDAFTITTASGVVTCVLSAAETEALADGGSGSTERPYVGQWDIQATLAGGDVVTIAKGGLTIEADITRPDES